jgi:hypothetical protein
MKSSVLGGLLAALATAGCVTPATLDADGQRVDVAEAVLRHMFHTMEAAIAGLLHIALAFVSGSPALSRTPHQS